MKTKRPPKTDLVWWLYALSCIGAFILAFVHVGQAHEQPLFQRSELMFMADLAVLAILTVLFLASFFLRNRKKTDARWLVAMIMMMSFPFLFEGKERVLSYEMGLLFIFVSAAIVIHAKRGYINWYDPMPKSS